MNILYMIGNGFDLAQNLKTSYNDFYLYIVAQKPKNAISAKMLDQINGEEHEKWSDMEAALGDFTRGINSKEEFEDFYYDLCEQLKQYLFEKVKDYEPPKQLVDKYIKDLIRPDYYITARETTSV